MGLTDKLKGHRPPETPERRADPLWKGPEEDGVTFSLLSRFLVCRERFRLLVVEGLQSAEGFNHRIEYGNMWHVCEEALAANPDPDYMGPMSWKVRLRNYTVYLCRLYPLQQEAVDKWYNVCLAQFPAYVRYWESHPDNLTRTPLLQEHKFRVPYKLPSGRTVILRGKWDSVDLIGNGKSAAVYLQENKTKGDVDEIQLRRQLTFDLQTMLYLTALTIHCRHHPLRDQARGLGAGASVPIGGVRYNVIRRPLSGGRGSIVQHKGSKNVPAESKQDYYSRLAGIIESDQSYFFMRWRAEVSAADLMKFRRECLDPILEQLCDWWQQVSTDAFVNEPGAANWALCGHWRHPFGVYNVLDEGGSTDVDGFLQTGSTVGLTQCDDLFPELR